MSNTINILNLQIGYDNNVVLKDINLSTNTNQLIAIIGLNGKGKTTLIKTLANILEPISGSFSFSSKDMFNLKEKELSRTLSLVTTKQTTIDNISVEDYIAFGRYPYTNWLGIESKTKEDKVSNAIAFCGIDELKSRNYNELSDGEMQRVSIARAISQDTELIILDEPTTHLDLINKVEVLKLLQKLVDEYNKTIILSTHMIDYALQTANEIWLVDNNTVHSYKPIELVENQKFKELFCNNNIKFDKDSMTFSLNK